MPAEAELLAARFLSEPDVPEAREAYASWFEARGDRRAEFLRAQAVVRAAEPDHPQRLALERRLSLARKNLDHEWLLKVEPERAHLLKSQVARCECVTAEKRKNVKLHDEPQDTECDAWRKVEASIERAASQGVEEFAPLRMLSPEERQWIVTLPPTVAKLKSVRRLILAGSALVRLPPELGHLHLRELVVHPAPRLHWFPFELSRMTNVRLTVSAHALYGNHRHRPTFPHLFPRKLPSVRPCSVCSGSFEDHGQLRVWISLPVGGDVLPLLVQACSSKCVQRLPHAPPSYLPRPHTGGLALQQPPPLMT
jgi:hypothetical protein